MRQLAAIIIKTNRFYATNKRQSVQNRRFAYDGHSRLCYDSDMKIVTPHPHKKFHVIEHPLVAHKMTLLRNKNTGKKQFSELVNEITQILTIAATENLELQAKAIETPLGTFNGKELKGNKLVILPILRAGLGMAEAILTLIPSAKVGHIGIFRNEKTAEPELYYFKVPNNSSERHYLICDPMLATAGSAIKTIDILKEKGIRDITFMCIVAAPEGVNRIAKAHPDVTLYAASLDEKLNEAYYIYPGLGDAGDRIFGTK